MYSCPSCGADDVGGRAVCRCGADLGLLQALEAVSDVWFNQALAELEAGRPGRALEWLSACCAARPADAEARLAQAKLWAQLGRWAEAQEALDRAAEVEPELAELAAVRQAIAEAKPAADQAAQRQVSLARRQAARRSTAQRRTTPSRLPARGESKD